MMTERTSGLTFCLLQTEPDQGRLTLAEAAEVDGDGEVDVEGMAARDSAVVNLIVCFFGKGTNCNKRSTSF